MSSVYRVLCLSHNPAMLSSDYESDNPGLAHLSLANARQTDHPHCDLVIGRYSYPLIEVTCYGTSSSNAAYPGCTHAHPQRWDASFLALLLFVYQSPLAKTSSPTSNKTLRIARKAAQGCWPSNRLTTLANELSYILEPTQ